ncbi:MAG: hypothetical protein ACFFG0_00650 [Candidatus Thorarchaeota archaeon]
MITNFIGKGIVELTQKEFDETPAMVAHELPNTNAYQTIFQFKFMDMYGKWNLVDIVHVNNENETEKGVNFLCTRIEIKG